MNLLLLASKLFFISRMSARIYQTIQGLRITGSFVQAEILSTASIKTLPLPLTYSPSGRRHKEGLWSILLSLTCSSRAYFKILRSYDIIKTLLLGPIRRIMSWGCRYEFPRIIFTLVNEVSERVCWRSTVYWQFHRYHHKSSFPHIT